MTSEKNISEKQERIAKAMARSGVCSRREAERLIEEGRVTLNRKAVTTPATKVSQEDEIRLDGELLKTKVQTELWLFHKPVGVITSRHDPQGRKTVFDLLPKEMPVLKTVGRLDFNSEGLLLLTNDGELSRKLELPSTGWKRRYKVRAHGRVNRARLKMLEQGVTIDGVKYAPATIEQEETANRSKTNDWYTVTLTEGKNREIRKMLEWAGLKVNRLIRLAYGPFQLGNLPKGEIKPVSGKVIKEQLGKL